jgi:protein-tyrosine phosphatase
MRIPPGSAQVLARLCEAGWQPVLAHPERYRSAAPIPELAVDWRAAGALLQLNGASLLKRYGDRPERIAGELLRAGLVDYVCSDYHARGRPRVAEYRALLEEQAGHEAAVVLTETNPQRLLADQAPLPIPLAPQSVAWRNRWRRFFR